jgi:hypothetical protein
VPHGNIVEHITASETSTFYGIGHELRQSHEVEVEHAARAGTSKYRLYDRFVSTSIS